MRKPRTRHGFTLLEIMMAVGILGFSVVIILGNVRHSLRLDRLGRQSLIASQAAQLKLEEILNSMEEGSKNKSDIDITDREGTFKAWPWLSYKVVVADAEPEIFQEVELEDLLSVQITVSWHDSVRREYTLSHLTVKEGEFR